jgi:hypothetical protein
MSRRLLAGCALPLLRLTPDRKTSELPSRVNSVGLLTNWWVLYHIFGKKSK